MLFTWLKNRRRRHILAQPFPDSWLAILERNVRLARGLSQDERARLHSDMQIIIAEKAWEGCRGVQVDDEMKVTIAAHVCLLLLGLEHDYFELAPSILIYPDAYVAEMPVPEMPEGPVEEEQERLGETVYRGAVVLAWNEVLRDSLQPERGRHLVLHEFAHQLDMLDGEVNGTPLLPDPAARQRWQQVMSRAFERHCRAVDRQRATLLDPYGAESEGEFFAVCTECFFTQPRELLEDQPRLYEVLGDYYRQDPAQRVLATD